jgi:UDP-N-acetylglucosamine--dolichyl-phosphate N-acetylglucosaminephosphotransferase
MELLIISMIISFITTFLITPYAIKFLYAAGIVGLDLHKKKKPKLPSGGGVCVAFGILAGLLSYIGIQTFVYGLQTNTTVLLAVISTVLIVMFIGFLDDLNIKSKKVRTKEGFDIRFGLPQWLKPLLTLPAAVPLMVMSVGDTSMAIPFLGTINFGILYPLLLIPIGVVGASNAVNLLGGFNGSETGMGIVYMLALGIYALLHESIGSIIFLISAASLLGFIKYNWVPAKILPGDSLTYLLGSLVAAGVIVGNMEKVGVIVLTPFIIEFFLKARSKFKASCLGKLRKDGKLDPPYGKKIYSLTHIIMQKPLTEKQVTIVMILIAAFFSLIPFLGII